MASNYTKDDPVFGTIDLDDQYVTDSWLVDKYVGGTLFGWGRNDYGQIGNGNTTYYSSPVQVGALNNWSAVSAGLSSGAIKTDGTLWTWGFNGSYQLGQGNTTSFSSPVQVGALNTWKKIYMAYAYAAAIKTDGTLWVWGTNTLGQLGQGNTTAYSSPVQVGTSTNWKQVAVPQDSNTTATSLFAVKTDGTLWVCGANDKGQLGLGYAGNYYSSPVQVGALTNWKQIAFAGGQNLLWNMWAAAVKTDGTLWAWGSNLNGQLGINVSANIYYSSPVQVGSLTNWKQISIASGTAGTIQPLFAGIKTDGTLWVWGSNSYGQLGIGSSGNVYYSSPIQVGTLTNWKQVSTSPTTISAVKTDGTLWAWGQNNLGQLGNGNTVYYSSPIQVGSLTNWKYISNPSIIYSTALGITFADLT